jgi:hypothetical protein
MLFAFIGQALAYSAITCEMASDTHQASMVMEHGLIDHSAMMDHSAMDHETMPPHMMENSGSDGCCGLDCQCPSHAGPSMSFYFTEYTSIILARSLTKISRLDLAILPSHHKSLYRPPISA